MTRPRLLLALEPEVEFYCQVCESFRAVKISDPDILCGHCYFVIATFRQHESNAAAPSQEAL